MTSFTSPVKFPIWGFYCDISDCHIIPARAWTPALMFAPTHALSRKVLSLTKPRDKIYKTKNDNLKEILSLLFNKHTNSCESFLFYRKNIAESKIQTMNWEETNRRIKERGGRIVWGKRKRKEWEKGRENRKSERRRRKKDWIEKRERIGRREERKNGKKKEKRGRIRGRKRREEEWGK